MPYQPDPEEQRLRRIERTIDLLKYHMQQENLLLQEIAQTVAYLQGQTSLESPTVMKIVRQREAIESIRPLYREN